MSDRLAPSRSYIDCVSETRLDVLDGPQAGASATLLGPRSRLTGAGACMSLLGADGLSITLERDMLSLVLGPTLEQNGERSRIARDAEIQVGGSRLRIRTTLRAEMRYALGVAAVILLGASIAVSPASGVVNQPVALASGVDKAEPTLGDRVAADEATLAWFNDTLRAEGLGDKIAARRGREIGMLIAEGVIAPDDLPAWRAALAALDARRNAPFLLNAVQVEARRVVVPFKVVGISADAGALRLADGGRFEIGDTLPGGWLLEAIDETGAAIRRGGDLIRLSL